MSALLLTINPRRFWDWTIEMIKIISKRQRREIWDNMGANGVYPERRTQVTHDFQHALHVRLTFCTLFPVVWQRRRQMKELGSLSNDDVDNSENAIWECKFEFL